MRTTAVYPGTFDPPTNGHIDLIIRGHAIFEKLIVAVADNSSKSTIFSIEERVSMLSEATSDLQGVTVVSFSGLLVNYLQTLKARIIIRGLRAVSDFEYELQLAHANRRMDSVVETIYMMPSEEFSFISSSLVKEIYSLGGEAKGLVPAPVDRALREKYSGSIKNK